MTPQLQTKSKEPSGNSSCSASMRKIRAVIPCRPSLLVVLSTAYAVRSTPVNDLAWAASSCAWLPLPTPISSTSWLRSNSKSIKASKGSTFHGR